MKIYVAVVLCLAVGFANASWAGHGGHGGAVISGPAGSVATSGNGAWGGHGWNGAWGGWGGNGWNGGWGGHGWNGAWNGGWNGAWNGAWNGDGSGHEGQWVPDHSEAHYDDGSYRPEHHYGGGHGHGW